MTDERTDNGADRREQILEAAISLFAERGYSLTSLMDIARTLGITGPAIYHWFERKDDILFQAMERTILRAIEVTEGILAEHDDPIDALARLTESHVDRVMTNVEANNVYRNERVHLAAKDDEAIRGHERDYEALYYDVYARGVQAGRLIDVDPRVGIGTFLGGCRWAYRTLGQIPDEVLAPTAVHLVMRSIVVDKDDPVFETLSLPSLSS